MFKIRYFLPAILIASNALAQVEKTPTVEVRQSLSFEDDLNFQNMELVLDRQLMAFEQMDLRGSIKYGNTIYPKTRLKESVVAFRKLVSEALSCTKTATQQFDCASNFSNKVNKQFALYAPVPTANEPGYRTNKPSLFTAYYSPDLVGSKTQDARFKNAIYAMPADEALRTSTREQIDFQGALAGKGLELFYVEDSLFDIYLLHIEGGGRLRFQNKDGTEDHTFLSYVGTNGHKSQFISRYMAEKGYIPKNEMTNANQRKFIEAHPEKVQEIFSSYASYVYFKESGKEPVGVENISLTEGRSMALDSTVYQHIGMITFIKATKPVGGTEAAPKMVPFGRFFLAQDKGGAIRGNARCDLYMGFGAEASFAASVMKVQGEQYFLIKK